MSASYNGATFNVISDAGFTPRWLRKPVIARKHYPFSDNDDIQYGGRERPTVVLKVGVDSDAAWNLLEAGADGVARTLSNPFGDGVNYASVKITDIRSIKRRTYAQEWEAEIEFVRV
ncbi:MAG: hypothetical protein ACYC4L_04620 [Chloroflexota bacterium]